MPGPVSRTLDAWSVYQVTKAGPNGPWTTHLTGFSREGCVGRVSTAVVRLDKSTRRALTASGRVYELAGRPGLNSDAFALWGAWKYRNGVQAERDVTELLEQELGAADGNPDA